MYKKEVPKLNKENFPTWQSLMKLHIDDVGDHAWSSVENGYTTPTGAPTTQELIEKRDHNKAMLEIASALSYSDLRKLLMQLEVLMVPLMMKLLLAKFSGLHYPSMPLEFSLFKNLGVLLTVH
jgi:hypothetical protein